MHGRVKGMVEQVDYCFVMPNAVGRDFLDFMDQFTKDNLDKFGKNAISPGRRFYTFDSREGDFGWPMQELKDKLAEHFKLGSYEIPPKLKDFVGHISDGGSIHTHTDPDLPGKRHVRINVLVKQPKGGIILMDDQPIRMEVGAAWLNLASKCPHGSTAVEGDGYRQAVSFGYQIDPARGDELFEIHKAWRDKVLASETEAAA